MANKVTMESVSENPKFTPVVAEFQSRVDREEVDQFGFIDLRQAFLTGSIPGDLEVDAESFNGVDDPNSIGERPSDVFDGFRKIEAVAAARSAAAKAEAAAASSAAAE